MKRPTRKRRRVINCTTTLGPRPDPGEEIDVRKRAAGGSQRTQIDGLDTKIEAVGSDFIGGPVRDNVTS